MPSVLPGFRPALLELIDEIGDRQLLALGARARGPRTRRRTASSCARARASMSMSGSWPIGICSVAGAVTADVEGVEFEQAAAAMSAARERARNLMVC